MCQLRFFCILPEDSIMFLSKVRKMVLAPRPKWFLANFSKSKDVRPYVDQQLLYKHAYAASFKHILKSLRPSEAQGQLPRWVNMGVALLGFPHGKKMSSLGNRLFIPLGRSVQSFMSIQKFAGTKPKMSINDWTIIISRNFCC